MAPQFFERVHGGGDRRLAEESDEQARLALDVEFACGAVRTPIAVMELRMGHVDPPRAGVRLRSVTAMTTRAAIGPRAVGLGGRPVAA
jgi:hypothetical protein